MATSTVKAVNRMVSLAHHFYLAMVEMREKFNNAECRDESTRVRRFFLPSLSLVFFFTGEYVNV